MVSGRFALVKLQAVGNVLLRIAFEGAKNRGRLKKIQQLKCLKQNALCPDPIRANYICGWPFLCICSKPTKRKKTLYANGGPYATGQSDGGEP